MIKIKVSNIIIELPKELVAQIPYFKALSNEFYKNNKEYVDINEPAISLNALTRIIDLFQGNKMPMLEEYIPTFEFLGIDYYEDKIEDKCESSSLQKYCNVKYERFNILNSYKHSLKPYIDNYTHKLTDREVKLNLRMPILHDCDVFDKFYIEIELPALPDGTYWKNKVGLNLIKEIIVDWSNYVTITYNEDFFKFEYYNSNDYWRIFDYSEKERIAKSCEINKIIIPLKLCESKDYAINLIACQYMNIFVKIALNDIKHLIEGNSCNVKIDKVTQYTNGFILDQDVMRYLAQNFSQVNLTSYKYINYNLFNTDNFIIDILQYLSNSKLPFQIIIKIDGEIISDSFEKLGYYYISIIYNTKLPIEIKLKQKKDYTVKIIIKYSLLVRYQCGIMG